MREKEEKIKKSHKTKYIKEFNIKGHTLLSSKTHPHKAKTIDKELCSGQCLVTQSCPTLCVPMKSSRSGSSVHVDSPGKNTGVGWDALLQGIFPTQGLNPGVPHYRQILYQLSHKGSPRHPYVPKPGGFMSQVIGSQIRQISTIIIVSKHLKISLPFLWPWFSLRMLSWSNSSTSN